MLVTKKVERPRELKWFQAGSMLYGDWGTSKAYVLGIAFALSGHASWFFLGLMSALTAMIGFCYMVICRLYPDGGGVYSSVKKRSQILAVIGALLLVADYVITASLSALDAFHYFNAPHPELWAMGAILTVGVINWFGPSKGGSIAAYIAVAASAVAGVLFLATLPSLPHVQLQMPHGSIPQNWSVFVGIVLALSGVEAIANMTGIMTEPVEQTSKKAIWPVLLEVSILTFLLGIAMNAIPGLNGHAEDMLRVLADHYIGPWYGVLISVVFGFLLLSAVNTAITDLVSIQFLMAKDHEVPFIFSKLNRYGMPWLALVVATLVPALILVFEHDVVGLAALYAIGVVGAITLNLGSCATNLKLDMTKFERILLMSGSAILFFVEITIAFQKHHALIFALSVLAVGLTLRFLAKKVIPAPIPAMVPTTVEVLTVSEAKEIAPLYHSSSMVAIRSLNMALFEEAVLRTKALGETSVYITYVEETPATYELPEEVAPSPESLELLAKAQAAFEKKGITAVPVWQIGNDAGKLIARAAFELKAKVVMIGTTRRSALVSLLRGDVLRRLAHNLPRDCRLVITG